MLLEVIATTLSEAIDIEKYGGNRIELVTGISEGGLTPSLALINQVCDSVSIPVYVMVRPHGKSFVYNEDDAKVIIDDVKAISKTNAKGIVFGALNEDLTIDEQLLASVIEAKGNLKLTFHRAIDKSIDLFKSFDIIKKYDVERILTSGGKDRAIDALDELTKLKALADTANIKILVGSGINVKNVQEFLAFDEVHIGSGVKFDGNNFNEIDERLMIEVINKLNN